MVSRIDGAKMSIVNVFTGEEMDEWLFPEELISLIRQKANELMVEFTTFADAVSRALGIVGYSMQEAEKAFENLFTQAEKENITNNGSSPKKYGMSLRKYRIQTIKHYDYIPKPLRNQPYQRRAY